jgi:predicted DsbA family dithiol-disulfide isomerase
MVCNDSWINLFKVHFEEREITADDVLVDTMNKVRLDGIDASTSLGSEDVRIQTDEEARQTRENDDCYERVAREFGVCKTVCEARA